MRKTARKGIGFKLSVRPWLVVVLVLVTGAVGGFYVGAYMQNVSDTFQVLMAQCAGPQHQKL